MLILLKAANPLAFVVAEVVPVKVPELFMLNDIFLEADTGLPN